MHVYPRESSIPSDSVRASIDTCININLENEREGRKEGEGTRGEGVEDKGSSECVLDPDTSRAPKFSRAIPDATPGDRATHTILPLSSSPTNSTLHVSRKILLKIPRRGKFFSNLSPFHIAYYPRKQISRGSRPTSRVSFHRWPTIKRIRSAVYNHETNFDLSSPLDCPRTLHPVSSPKSHRRNGGRGKNRLPGVFRDPEGLIAFLDTRQR